MLLRLVLLCLAVLGFCLALGYAVITWPQYIELSLPPPSEGDWGITERTVQMWVDDSRFYIWRHQTRVRADCCPPDRDGLVAIVHHFDDWMINNGWERVEFGFDPNPCHIFVHESVLLGLGSEGDVVYMRPDHSTYVPGPTVCLRVWFDGSSFYHVVLLTANPAPVTAFRKGWD